MQIDELLVLTHERDAIRLRLDWMPEGPARDRLAGILAGLDARIAEMTALPEMEAA